ncbi:MAG: hypothetical protein O2923_10535 [Verrucomicrobia bacterium]|nr:hypothetical protein [Verrucomicrobiota bacterium]MDA1088073.1 hypothetical protein [Verrucomicrobiota bacterium]
MRLRHKLLVSLAMAAVVWTVISWPLAKYVTQGIPCTLRQHIPTEARRMASGDHLQLHYNFWLARDMMFGETPLFYDLYEFNSGDDSETLRRKAYYLPFSLVYAVLSPVTGPALAWNVTAFLAMWIAFLFSWRLASRYTHEDVISALAAVIAVVLPVQWQYYCGGSPAGFSMMWIPVLWFGLDRAVRDGCTRGGALAGLALFGASICDAHVFFFGTFSVPLWCVVAFSTRTDFRWRRPADYVALAKPLIPFMLFGIPIALYTMMKKSGFKGSSMDEGRSIGEVALFSPHWEGLISTKDLGVGNHIHVGALLIAIIAIGLVLRFWRRARTFVTTRSVVTHLLLVGAGIGIVCMALGTNGPQYDAHGNTLTSLAREYVPMYDKIRQPAKIFCLMPALLSVLLAVGLRQAASLLPKTIGEIITIASVIGIVGGYRQVIYPGICLMDTEQPAYAAVARDAESEGVAPHVLVAPLWPGNDASASLYQHYISLYRIRMVNGYHPVVSDRYTKDVFRFYQSVNHGVLDEHQLDRMRENGIGYVIMHEGAFEDKVTPYPPTYTLERLLNHPRLRLLDHADGIWSFAVTDEPRPHREWRGPGVYFPMRAWQAESSAVANSVVEVRQHSECANGAYARLASTGATLEHRRVRTSYAPDCRFLLRARGHGQLQANVLLDDESNNAASLEIDNDAWQWIEVPAATYDGYDRLKLRAAWVSGTVDVDMFLLTAGTLENDGTRRRAVGAAFFHHGETDIETGSALLAVDRVTESLAWYGWGLPMPVGRYRATLEVDSASPPGTILGHLLVKGDGLAVQPDMHITAGEPVHLELDQEHNLPIRLEVHFKWNGNLTIRNVELTRTERDDQ